MLTILITANDAILAQDNNGYALTNCVSYNEYTINDEDIQSLTCEENTTCYTFNTTNSNQLLENDFINTENAMSKCHHISNRSWYELSFTTSMINSGSSISRYSLCHSFLLFITLLITIT